MNDSEPAKRPSRRSLNEDQTSSTKRYFFDVHDGDKLIRDETGIDLQDPDAVHGEAYTLLRELVQDKLPEGRQTFTVNVRDETGTCIYTGEMAVDGKRYGP